MATLSSAARTRAFWPRAAPTRIFMSDNTSRRCENARATDVQAFRGWRLAGTSAPVGGSRVGNAYAGAVARVVCAWTTWPEPRDGCPRRAWRGGSAGSVRTVARGRWRARSTRAQVLGANSSGGVARQLVEGWHAPGLRSLQGGGDRGSGARLLCGLFTA